MRHEQRLEPVEKLPLPEYTIINYLADLTPITEEVLGPSLAAVQLAEVAERTAAQLLDGGWAYNANLPSLFSLTMMKSMATYALTEEQAAIVSNGPRNPKLSPRN